MNQPPHRTRRDEQAARTRRRICEVALRLIAERGYDATSIQDIATEMGVTKAAIYHHYQAKADILRAISTPALDAITTLIDEVAGLRSRRARIDRLIEGILDVALSRRAVMRVLASDPAMRTEMSGARQLSTLRAKLPEVLFGPHPTAEQRFAAAAGVGLVDAVIDMSELPDEEMRRILSAAMRRLINIRS